MKVMKANGKELNVEGRIALRPREAARLLGVSHQHIYAAVRSGELPARKLGETWMISRAALEDWLRGDAR